MAAAAAVIYCFSLRHHHGGPLFQEEAIMRYTGWIAGAALLLALSPVLAESGMGYGKSMDKAGDMGMGPASVMISTPADGAMLPQKQPVMVSYEAVTGPKGDHVHIYVDGERVAVLRQLSGEHNLGMLKPGMHKIGVEIVTNAHQHIGVGKEISVDVR
jgi:hypothetical protein